MRIAVVLAAVHHRSSLEACPVDAERLLELAAGHGLELFVDQANAASEQLRRAGVPVSVSIQRSLVGTDGRRVSADALQARALLRSHDRSPFDAVVYGGEVPVDYAWYEPSLHSLPRGVALGSGLAHDLRPVWDDRRLFARLARRVWSLTGLAASADFLLCDVEPEAFGLRDDGRLPPRYTSGVAEEPAPSPPLAGRWIVVAATSLGAQGLESLIDRVGDRCPPETGVTYVVLTRPGVPEGRSLETALLGSCPEPLRRRIVVAAAGDDGVAADFLAAADIVVAASRAELAVPGVADAARRRGWIVLDESPPGQVAQGAFPPCMPTAPRNGCNVEALTWEEPVCGFRRALDEVSGDVSDDELLVVHAHGRIGPAVRLFELSDIRGVDLVVWGQADAVLGSPDPGYLYPHALAVRGGAVPALARAVADCESIWDLICWAVSYEWIDRLRLLVLPAPLDSECWEVREIDHVAASWSPASGILPAPRWTPAPAGAPVRPPHPEPVYLPRRRFFPPPTASPRIALETWARRSRWPERLRVALPWRWGLLDRVMRGRW